MVGLLTNHTLCSTRTHMQRARRVIFNNISIVTTCPSAAKFSVNHSKHKLHPANWLSNIFGCIYSTHFQSWKNCRFCKLAFNPQEVNTYFLFACYQIKYYRFSELDEQLILRGKKCWKKELLFPCLDLNDLTAITPKHTLGDNSCSLGERTEGRCCFQRRHLQPTACHFHVTKAEVRVDILPWVRSRQVFMWLRRSCS